MKKFLLIIAIIALGRSHCAEDAKSFSLTITTNDNNPVLSKKIIISLITNISEKGGRQEITLKKPKMQVKQTVGETYRDRLNLPEQVKVDENDPLLKNAFQKKRIVSEKGKIIIDETSSNNILGSLGGVVTAFAQRIRSDKLQFKFNMKEYKFDSFLENSDHTLRLYFNTKKDNSVNEYVILYESKSVVHNLLVDKRGPFSLMVEFSSEKRASKETWLKIASQADTLLKQSEGTSNQLRLGTLW